MKTQTKALIASLIVVALGLSAVSGVTYSWWSDSENTDIDVTTGYVKVETSGLTVTKGGQTVTGASGSMPEGLQIVYSDTGSTTWYSSSSSATLIVTGDPSESIEIKYKATFSWSVAAKYIMDYETSSQKLDVTMTITDGNNNPVSRGFWIPAGESDEASYNVELVICGLGMELNDSLTIRNDITQFGNQGDIWDGSSSQITPNGNVYKIEKASQLAWVAKQVNDGNKTFAGSTLELMTDIDLNNLDWKPIGKETDETNKRFKGVFNGNGHTISNMKVGLNGGYTSAGLFGDVGKATIRDLKFVAVEIKNHVSQTPNNYYACGAGVAVGSMQCGGVVLNVTVDGAEIEATKNVGGIVGYVNNTDGNMLVRDCSVKNVQLTAIPNEITKDGSQKTDNGDKVGGIVGLATDNNLSCDVRFVACSVSNATITAYRDIGGFAGCATGGVVFDDCSIGNVGRQLDTTVDPEYVEQKPLNNGEFVGRGSDNIDYYLNV